MRIFLLAPGPSMSQALADSVRGHFVGVVNNCYELAPWAEFLVANDPCWWRKNSEAKNFLGEKYSTQWIKGVERVMSRRIHKATNSGLVAIHVAARIYKAREIILLGYSMRGSHFFGRYTNGLSNTDAAKRELHKKQYARWAEANPSVRVINCTPRSSLHAFPKARLEDIL